MTDRAPAATPRHALVVGGARGIGRAIGAALLDDGWQLSIAGRSSRAEELEGRGARWHEVDASEPDQCRALLAAVDPVDALVVSCGRFRRVPLLEETPEGWRSMLDHNLDPVFFLSQAALPGMRERGWGRILTFGLANADRLEANPMVVAHGVAKIGVLALTRTLARVGAGRGVTVNCISPGFVDSGSLEPDYVQRMVASIPAGRLGTVDEVAAVARFLLSDAAAYVNGANIQVSGGWGL